MVSIAIQPPVSTGGVSFTPRNWSGGENQGTDSSTQTSLASSVLAVGKKTKQLVLVPEEYTHTHLRRCFQV